ncbi:MAG: alpha/beta hydrolase [Desulfobacterales bacterium]|nr:alpha/beta hydrolase [Desulfobacterales bacterium]
MKIEETKIKTDDNVELFLMKWLPDDKNAVKGVVQLSHGMAEHISRYGDFASFLAESNFAVFGNDHRGHGKTAGSLENVGFFAEENGWELVVDDMHLISKLIKKEYPNVPVFTLGHSMGSFLCRHFMILYGNEINGAILSGTSGDPGFLGTMGMGVAKLASFFKGKKALSPIMDALSFGSFNKGFKPAKTKFDWLSRDEASVQKYIDDPYCGGIFSSGFFQDMLRGIKFINKKENIAKIPKDLPIYIFSGEKCAVGKNTKGVMEVANSFINAGIKDVSHKIYKDARHEMLNETNKKEVYSDVLNWLNAHI